MEYRRLGNSGLQVSALSFGSWITFGNQVNNNVAEECLKYAYDNGVNFFDNAEVYAQGKSEKVMGKILKKMKWSRDSYIISSKAFFGINGLKESKPTQKGCNRKHLVEACDQALKRLDMDYLDLFFCHRPDKNTPVEETVWTMHNLIQQGKILYWGTSEWSAQEVQEAITVARQHNLIPPTMEQPQYSMFWRQKIEVELDKLCREYGLGTTIWSPLASGVLTGKYNRKDPKDSRLSMDELKWIKERNLIKEHLQKVEKLTALAKEIGTNMPRLALAWCLINPNVSTVITGASKVAQLKDNMKALEVTEKLTPEVLGKIEGILKNKPEKPTF